jgi:hypothetical protein
LLRNLLDAAVVQLMYSFCAGLAVHYGPECISDVSSWFLGLLCCSLMQQENYRKATEEGVSAWLLRVVTP